MNRKIRSSLDILFSELDVLRAYEMHNILGGIGAGGGSFSDVWNDLLNGDLTDVPSGKYDFNNKTFTPMDSSMSNASWHIVIPVVDVPPPGQSNGYNGYGFGGYGDSNSGLPGSGTNNGYGSGSYNYNGQYPTQGYSGYTPPNPTQGMSLTQKEIYQYMQNNSNGSALNLESYFMNKFNTSGGGTTLYNPNNPNQGSNFWETNPANSANGDGVYYIVSSKDTQSLQTIDYQTGKFGGYNTELELFQFYNEHYGNNNRAILTYLLEGQLASEQNINTHSVLRDSNNYKFGIDRSKLVDDLVIVTKFLAQFKSLLNGLVPFLGDLSDESHVIITGSIAGFLDSGLEKELFDIWWHGKANNGSYVMSDSDFNELKTLKPSLNSAEMGQLKPILANDGKLYYTSVLGTYEADTNNQAIIDKYKGALGKFTGIYDSTGQMVGLYDYYNFDNGTRSFGSEYVTRLINEMAPEQSSNFDITYGNIPFEVFEKLKGGK